MAAEFFVVPYQCVVVSGLAVPGAKLTFYQTGTTTKLPIYTTSALTTERTNPVVANGAGHIPDTYLNGSQVYRVQFRDKLGTLIEDVDPYIPGTTVLGITITTASGASVSTAAALAAVASPVNDQTAIFDGHIWVVEAHNGTFTAADTAQGLYIRSTSDTSKMWVRKYVGAVDPRWWGFTLGTGNGTANSTAISAMLATLKARGYSEASTYINLGTVRFPLGTADVATTIDLTDGTITLEGETTGQAGAAGSRLKFPAGQTGIILQRYNTVGGGGSASGSNEFADASIIRGLTLVGGYAGTEGEYHGIQPRCRAIIENCGIQGFEGDGIHIDATSGGNPEGNANGFLIRDCRIVSCRDGIFIDGADANAGKVEGSVDLSSNRRWGINDDSFLGNMFASVHADGNGAVAGTTPTMVTNSGNQYGVIDGQAVGASTNAPSGTTADNTWWYYIGAGGADASKNIAAWVSGTTYRSGGAYKCKGANARSLFVGCYFEGGQGLSQIDARSMIVGGILASVRNVGSAPLLDTKSGELYLQSSGITTDLRGEFGGVNLPTGNVYKINNVQVLGPRQTGWTAATGTATRTTFDTASVTLPQLAERVKAMLDDLFASGPLG